MLTATKNVIQDNLNSQEAANIRQDLQDLKQDVTSLARHVKEDSAAIASEKFAFFKREGKKQADRLEAQVHARPVQSIAIAFAAGAVLALIARR